MNKKQLDECVKLAGKHEKMYDSTGFIAIGYLGASSTACVHLTDEEFIKTFPVCVEKPWDDSKIELTAEYGGRTFFCLKEKVQNEL